MLQILQRAISMKSGAKRWPLKRPWPGPAAAQRRLRTQRPPDRSKAKGGMPHRGCLNDSEDRGWTAVTFAYENTPSSDDDRVSYEKVAATYSPTWWGSTIGDGELNFSVRNGKRWILTAITATVCFWEKTTRKSPSVRTTFFPRQFMCHCLSG